MGFEDKFLEEIYQKVKEGIKIERNEIIKLFKSNDLLGIGRIANLVRERLNGRKTYYIINRHINYTNICKNLCKFCAFAKEDKENGAFTLTIEEILNKASNSNSLRTSEFHIVGGLNPNLSFDYYLNMLKSLKELFPNVIIQAFTAVEIHHFSQISGLSLKDTLLKLKEAGLDSIPGGGAEIFSTRVRKAICPNKIDGEKWLEVMRVAHELNFKTNATMLYGHIETIEERADHLIRLRMLQDETGGFMAFIPLAYHPKNTKLGGKKTNAFDDLKTLAISRIALDNFPHIKAFWVMLGVKLAQVSLSFGVDDIDGTVEEEYITHSAGAEAPQRLTEEELRSLILEASSLPVRRDTLYNPLN